MAYSSIPDSQIDADSPLISDTFFKLRDNPIAIANGDSGAPKIQSAALDTGVVGSAAMAAGAIEQAAINTSQGTVSVYQNGYTTLPGGQYGFWCEAQNSATGNNIGGPGKNGTGYTASVRMESSGGSTTCYMRQRYINSSPPYDMGHGEIAHFVFALVENSSGKVLATYAADCAPWHYNGPTDIKAVARINGKKYAIDKNLIAGLSAEEKKAVTAVLSERTLPQHLKISKDAEMMEREVLTELEKTRKNERINSRLLNQVAKLQETKRQITQERNVILTSVLTEIDQAWKNKDMPIIPHPFEGNNLSGKTIVLIDPTSALADDLALRSLTGDNVSEMLQENYIKIDNTKIEGITAPKGVLIVGASMK